MNVLVDDGDDVLENVLIDDDHNNREGLLNVLIDDGDDVLENVFIDDDDDVL